MFLYETSLGAWVNNVWFPRNRFDFPRTQATLHAEKMQTSKHQIVLSTCISPRRRNYYLNDFITSINNNHSIKRMSSRKSAPNWIILFCRVRYCQEIKKENEKKNYPFAKNAVQSSPVGYFNINNIQVHISIYFLITFLVSNVFSCSFERVVMTWQSTWIKKCLYFI